MGMTTTYTKSDTSLSVEDNGDGTYTAFPPQTNPNDAAHCHTANSVQAALDGWVAGVQSVWDAFVEASQPEAKSEPSLPDKAGDWKKA